VCVCVRARARHLAVISMSSALLLLLSVLLLYHWRRRCWWCKLFEMSGDHHEFKYTRSYINVCLD